MTALRWRGEGDLDAGRDGGLDWVRDRERERERRLSGDLEEDGDRPCAGERERDPEMRPLLLDLSS